MINARAETVEEKRRLSQKPSEKTVAFFLYPDFTNGILKNENYCLLQEKVTFLFRWILSYP